MRIHHSVCIEQIYHISPCYKLSHVSGHESDHDCAHGCNHGFLGRLLCMGLYPQAICTRVFMWTAYLPMSWLLPHCYQPLLTVMVTGMRHSSCCQPWLSIATWYIQFIFLNAVPIARTRGNSYYACLIMIACRDAPLTTSKSQVACNVEQYAESTLIVHSICSKYITVSLSSGQWNLNL